MKTCLRKIFFRLLEKSLIQARKEQGLNNLARQLKQISPDITDQYSCFKVQGSYLETKVRAQHAFQISLVNKIINEFDHPTIVDIGDSSGTHLQYLIGLHKKDKVLRCLGVNLDAEAIKKIQSKGFEAIQARAENLDQYNINADIFLCFETLEHLMDPIHFLHELSTKTKASYLIITVPYVRQSRIGLHHLRNKRDEEVFAENTHIFEFCPKDLKLIVRHAGWQIVSEKIYLQYPKYNTMRITKPLWKKYDFEGFYGLILKRDNTWSKKYLDWQD